MKHSQGELYDAAGKTAVELENDLFNLQRFSLGSGVLSQLASLMIQHFQTELDDATVKIAVFLVESQRSLEV